MTDFTDSERELAEWLHDTYEKNAKLASWQTKEECHEKSFDELPIPNQVTMLLTVRELQKKRKDDFINTLIAEKDGFWLDREGKLNFNQIRLNVHILKSNLKIRLEEELNEVYMACNDERPQEIQERIGKILKLYFFPDSSDGGRIKSVNPSLTDTKEAPGTHGESRDTPLHESVTSKPASVPPKGVSHMPCMCICEPCNNGEHEHCENEIRSFVYEINRCRELEGKSDPLDQGDGTEADRSKISGRSSVKLGNSNPDGEWKSPNPLIKCKHCGIGIHRGIYPLFEWVHDEYGGFAECHIRTYAEPEEETK